MRDPAARSEVVGLAGLFEKIHTGIELLRFELLSNLAKEVQTCISISCESSVAREARLPAKIQY